MNKTISINIAGFVFNIEEGAYDKLKHYLAAIKNNFKHEEDCNEIMEDIEARIAELFQEKLSDRKEVIVDSDVESIIVVMGKPEEYLSDDEPIHEEKITDSEPKKKKEETKNEYTNWYGKKRLYRDETDGVIGGICSGIGHYLGIDPVLIRAGFVIISLLGGSGMLLYIILWIVMPQAKTTAEILEMKGQPVNLDSIKDHVKDVKNTIVDNTKGARQNIKSAVDKGVKAGSKFGYVLGKVIGVGFISFGLFLLLFLSIVFLGNTGVMPLMSSEEAVNLSYILGAVYPDERVTIAFVALLLFTLIPVVSILFTGVKLVLGSKIRFRTVSVIVTIIWFLSFGSLVLMGIELGINFKEHVELEEEVLFDKTSENTLFVDVMEDDMFSSHLEFRKISNFSELLKIDDDHIYLGYPNLEITPVYDSSYFGIIVHRESNGVSNQDAINRAESITYDLNLSENKLLLSPYFMINAADKFRGQLITVEILIPYGKELVFGNNIDRILVDVEDSYYRYSPSYANTKWKIDEYDELRCVGCDENQNKRYYKNAGNFIEDKVDSVIQNVDSAIENIDDAIESAID